MELYAEEKSFMDLAEKSFGHFLDDDARDNSSFFVQIPSCNTAAVCNCSFALLNCSEITSLSEIVH